MLRFSIPDVLIVYLSLGYASGDKSALVRMAAAFGPRERVRVCVVCLGMKAEHAPL